MKEAHAQVTPNQEISLEIMEILVSFYFLKQEQPESDDLLSNFRTLRFIKLLHDDIILRLCKFADGDSRSWSFDQAHRKLCKRSNHQINESELKRRIKEFRDLVRPLREHRDAYIAHHSKRDRTHLKPPELRPVVRLAVEISDMLAAQDVKYEMSGIDLRADILGQD